LRSKMRRSNVVQCFNVDHVNTMRALDFQRIDVDNISCRSPCIMPNIKEEVKPMATDDANIDKDSDD
jgi:hypothetical protein